MSKALKNYFQFRQCHNYLRTFANLRSSLIVDLNPGNTWPVWSTIRGQIAWKESSKYWCIFFCFFIAANYFFGGSLLLKSILSKFGKLKYVFFFYIWKISYVFLLELGLMENFPQANSGGLIVEIYHYTQHFTASDMNNQTYIHSVAL